jgi:cation-transporting ATPase I
MLTRFDAAPLVGAVAGAAAGAARSTAQSVTSVYDTTRRVRNVARNALTGDRHWKAGQRLHLALRHPDGDAAALAHKVAEELVEHPDVLTAYWDGGLARLVVTVAEDAATDQVTEQATALAARFGLDESVDPTLRDTSHPGDPAEVRVSAAAILLDAAGAAGALAGRSLRLPPGSRIITAAVTLLRENPRFRAVLRQRFGTSGMELVLAGANAAAHGIGQTPLALVLDGILRGNQLTEAVARAAAFEALHDDVCHHRRTSLPCPTDTRPPLKVTPAAEYAPTPAPAASPAPPPPSSSRTRRRTRPKPSSPDPPRRPGTDRPPSARPSAPTSPTPGSSCATGSACGSWRSPTPSSCTPTRCAACGRTTPGTACPTTRSTPSPRPSWTPPAGQDCTS